MHHPTPIRFPRHRPQLPLAILLTCASACAAGESMITETRGSETTTELTTTAGASTTDTAGPADPTLGDAELANAVQALLGARCGGCHGDGGPKAGGIDYITDLTALVASGKVVREDPASSPLFIRITSADAPMPPASTGVRLTADEIGLIAQWIEAGAPAAPQLGSCADNPFISLDAMVASMNADIAATPLEDRPFIRYVTLTHFYNIGLCGDALEIYRGGIAKLMNGSSGLKVASFAREIAPW